MSVVINVTPELRYRLVFRTGEIDFDANLTLDQLAEQDGKRWISGAATREFERELQWAVEEFFARMEQKGLLHSHEFGLPPGMREAAASKGAHVYGDSVLVFGPFYTLDYSDQWPRHDEDGEELPRRWPTSLEDSKGRVSYRMGCYFAEREHVLRQLVEYRKDPGLYRAARNAKKVNGLWQPQAPATRKHFLMEAHRDN